MQAASMTISREMIELRQHMEYNTSIKKNELELYVFIQGDVCHVSLSTKSNSKEMYLV